MSCRCVGAAATSSLRVRPMLKYWQDPADGKEAARIELSVLCRCYAGVTKDSGTTRPPWHVMMDSNSYNRRYNPLPWSIHSSPGHSLTPFPSPPTIDSGTHISASMTAAAALTSGLLPLVSTRAGTGSSFTPLSHEVCNDCRASAAYAPRVEESGSGSSRLLRNLHK